MHRIQDRGIKSKWKSRQIRGSTSPDTSSGVSSGSENSGPESPVTDRRLHNVDCNRTSKIEHVSSKSVGSDTNSSDDGETRTNEKSSKNRIWRRSSVKTVSSTTTSTSVSTEAEPVSEASSFTFEPDDILFDTNCGELLRKHILANSNELHKVKDIAQKMLNKCVESYSINIGIIGEPKSGKTSLIEAIFGNSEYQKDRNLPKNSRLKGLRNDYEFPGRPNIKFAEIKALVSPRYDERIEYLRKIQIDDFDLVIFITENHLRNWTLWMAEKLLHKRIPFIFVRTKIDRTLIDCMNNFPRTFNNEKTVNLIKRRFCETALHAGIDVPTYVVASTNPDFWDFRRMVQNLGDSLPESKRRLLTLSLPPLTRRLVFEKQKVFLRNIWMVSTISVVSGLMEIPGFAISADTSVLKKEIENYRLSLGLTDDIIYKVCKLDQNPALAAAWELIFYNTGMHSILRQSAMELNHEELPAFAEKIPVLGAGISFPATCSALKFILQELTDMALKHYSRIQIFDQDDDPI